MRDHRKLRAFELADRLVLQVYQHTRTFPREELFGLSAQIRRSSLSMPSNSVEGCARHSKSDYIRFLDIAFASARELEYQLSLAERPGYLQPRECTRPRREGTLGGRLGETETRSGPLRPPHPGCGSRRRPVLY